MTHVRLINWSIKNCPITSQLHIGGIKIQTNQCLMYYYIMKSVFKNWSKNGLITNNYQPNENIYLWMPQKISWPLRLLMHTRSFWADFNHGLVVHPQGCQGCQKIYKKISKWICWVNALILCQYWMNFKKISINQKKWLIWEELLRFFNFWLNISATNFQVWIFRSCWFFWYSLDSW